jgi:hypothetical protein
MLAILMLIVVLPFCIAAGIMGRIIYVGYKEEKATNEKKTSKKKESPDYTPSMILVNTVGTIMLREYKLIEKIKDPTYTIGMDPTQRYLFSYDNVRCRVSFYEHKHIYYADLEVDDVPVSLTREETQVLFQHFNDAFKLKQEFEAAEKEKQRQLAACDALENIMTGAKPKQPILTTGNTPETITINYKDLEELFVYDKKQK